MSAIRLEAPSHPCLMSNRMRAWARAIVSARAALPVQAGRVHSDALLAGPARPAFCYESAGALRVAVQ